MDLFSKNKTKEEIDNEINNLFNTNVVTGEKENVNGEDDTFEMYGETIKSHSKSNENKPFSNDI
jgi:hypothetical protein